MNFSKENILVLSIFGIFFSLIVFFYANEIHEDVYGMIYVSPIIVGVVLSLSLALHYKKSRSFYWGFLFLGLSTLSLLIAEILWSVMPYFGIPQYESYPDIFYIGYALLALTFPWFILKHYKKHFSAMHYLMVSLITVIGILSYVILSGDDLYSSSSILGLTFVILTSLLIGVSTITLFLLRDTDIHKIWMIIVFSFFLGAIGDIFYYADENTNNWSMGDFVNIIWFVSYLILIYALIGQRSIFMTKAKF